ncbi:MAG: creatininase family protein [Alphaproteobacteria bacterium]|jgi:creatinine amidohydrolase
MRLDLSTWQEVEAYLTRSTGIIIPTGSTEQHGPMGLIGTDALCSQTISEHAATQADALVAPTLALTPAPFNVRFPGTISISEPLFEAFTREIVEGLASQGFRHIYFLNGHGANLAPLRRIAADPRASTKIQVKSWWDFAAVNVLRNQYYGEWEGMHATPSEVAITQATYRIVPPGDAAEPPRKLTPEFIKAHAGDKHGPPDEHRRDFPDGRVGSHSALARPEQGEALIKVATQAVAEDYCAFLKA